ncbi:MAG TPA: hypothetical protein VNU47_00425, partial [Candidatus Paceibacterota bacterium]|nr:hypothetical protein [Candidatus Paceibacterota bacterium]
MATQKAYSEEDHGVALAATDEYAAEAHTEEEASPIHVVLKAEEVFSFGGFPVTNSLIMAWIVVAILIAFAFAFGRSLKMIPGKLQA